MSINRCLFCGRYLTTTYILCEICQARAEQYILWAIVLAIPLGVAAIVWRLVEAMR